MYETSSRCLYSKRRGDPPSNRTTTEYGLRTKIPKPNARAVFFFLNIRHDIAAGKRNATYVNNFDLPSAAVATRAFFDNCANDNNEYSSVPIIYTVISSPVSSNTYHVVADNNTARSYYYYAKRRRLGRRCCPRYLQVRIASCTVVVGSRELEEYILSIPSVDTLNALRRR